jgi:hypothetical protein
MTSFTNYRDLIILDGDSVQIEAEVRRLAMSFISDTWCLELMQEWAIRNMVTFKVTLTGDYTLTETFGQSPDGFDCLYCGGEGCYSCNEEGHY